MRSSLSYSGSSKRSKGFDIIRKVVSCLVDGCTSDISQGREYHRRHKVCDLHSKMPLVTIGGREQRFCQQCSRFHSLGEFDNGKRSCRKRLDGHNRRRRKPPSTPLSKSSRRFVPNQQGALLSFSTPTPQLPPSPSPMVDPSWAGQLKFDQTNATGPYYSLNNNAIGTMEHYNKLGTNKPISEPCFSKPVLGSNNEYNMTRVANSDCALSLLSSAATAESRGIGLGHFLVPNTQYAEVSSSYNACSNIHCQAHRLFSDGSDGPGSSGVDRTLTFKWE